MKTPKITKQEFLKPNIPCGDLKKHKRIKKSEHLAWICTLGRTGSIAPTP